MTDKTKIPDKQEELQRIGKCAMDNIREMVAALECDYDRLEELRGERDSYEVDEDENAAPDGPGYKNDAEAWAAENPEDAEELRQLEEDAGDCKSRDDAEERIHEDPLSLQFRSDWCASKEEMEPAEYELLLSTGGPATRIIGEVRDGEAHSARLEAQDWFMPWIEYVTTGSDHEALLTYARCFCMGS